MVYSLFITQNPFTKTIHYFDDRKMSLQLQYSVLQKCKLLCVCALLYLLVKNLSMLLSIRDVGPETKELKVRLVEKNSKGERE